MMNRRTTLRLLIAAPALSVLPRPSQAKGANEFLVCSQAIFASLLNQITAAYQTVNPDLTVGVREDSFDVNLRYLDGGAGDVAVLDRPPPGGEPPPYVDRALAIVPYALVADPRTGATALTTAQVSGIFAGRFTNWSQVGGPNVPIVAIERPRNSGTTALFTTIFGPTSATGTIVDNTSNAVVEAVKRQPGAIGYVGVPYAKLEGTKILALDGAQPSADTIASGAYKFFTTIHAVTLGQPTPRASRFIAFAESRRELLHAAGFYTTFETKRR
jgi:phosphate transport system substrate-binding protein